MTSHNDEIIDQFTRQADCFAAAPQIRDEKALKQVLELTAAGPEDTVLDVACGPGHLACAFAEVTRHATGIDLTPAMLERARLVAAEKNLSNVAWEVGDVYRLPYAGGSFSIVTSRYALHHILKPEEVVGEMARVCAVGGKVAVIDMAAPPAPEKALALNSMEKLRDPSHVRALTLEEMNALFRSAGLAAPQLTFYRLEFELERVLQGSSPRVGDADKVRRMFRDSLANDGMGVNARLEGGEIWFSYPIAIYLSEKRSGEGS